MSNIPEKKFSKLIIVMRHGERADDNEVLKNSNNSKENIIVNINETDPKLTIKGISQAYSIGDQLKEIIKKYYNRNENISPVIKIFSSPFIRTLMTADGVINGLNYNNNDTQFIFNLNYGLYEYLNPIYFKCHPEDSLEMNKSNADFNLDTDLNFLTKYKNIFKQKDEMPVYPENINQIITRYTNTIKKINDITSANEIIIIVTHGYGVQAIAEYLNITEEWFYVDYCSTFIFGIEDDNTQSFYITTLNPII